MKFVQCVGSQTVQQAIIHVSLEDTSHHWGVTNLSIIAEKEPDAVICIPPFQKLVVRCKIEAKCGCTQKAIKLGGVYQRSYSFMALYKIVSWQLSPLTG